MGREKSNQASDHFNTEETLRRWQNEYSYAVYNTAVFPTGNILLNCPLLLPGWRKNAPP